MTLYERDEAAGGLIRFGVPEFKIEKRLVERRVEQLVAEGVEFRFGVDVGADVDVEELRAGYDAVVLATGRACRATCPCRAGSWAACTSRWSTSPSAPG